MTLEVQQLRPEHNDAPASSIRAVAIALRQTLDEAAFDRVVQALPVGAIEFWAADSDTQDRC